MEAQRDGQLLRGALPLLILTLLSERDSYGYELVERLAALGLQAGTGLVYPALSRMERDGLLDAYTAASSQGPPRKYFGLTVAGEHQRNESRQQWQHLQRAVQDALTSTGDL